jgi:peptide/nickel transport system substrate-binding protein
VRKSYEVFRFRPVGSANFGRVCWGAALALWLAIAPADAEPAHGLAMHGQPKHPAGFSHFPYTNPAAPRGGRLVLGTLGSFDSLNPFIIRGVSASGLREYVFESLMVRSGDEPFSLYGLVAESVELPPNRAWVTFNLRADARFADGHAITPEDVIFSHAVLKERGWPYHRSHYGKVARAEKIAERSVRFTFASSEDREVALLLALMPILPSHRLDAEAFDRTTLDPPLGSGPYTVARVDAGRSITYQRNQGWWARDLPVSRGRFNFDEIRVEFFRDATSMFEAFKAGEIGVRTEDDAQRWVEGYSGSALADGRMIKRELDTGLPSGMSGLVFNTRRPHFSDARVRRAFILLFDGEWMNRNLFNGLLKRTESYFDRSYLSSHGRPVDARERALLAPFLNYVKLDVLDGTYRLPIADGSGENRENLKAAYELLVQAGYEIRGGQMVKEGRQLGIEFLAQTRAQERLLLSYARTLSRLGIDMQVRQVDSAQYNARLKSFDFDMLQWAWPASLSPGNEQINRWSSAAADTEGTLNLAGVKSPAADAMIDALLKANAEEDFTAAVRAFDRVLMSGEYVVPLFHLPKVWVAHWSYLKFPATLPLAGFDVDTWWTERR